MFRRIAASKIRSVFSAERTDTFSDAKPPLRRQNEPIQEKEYLTDAFGREAVAFIEHHAEKPFFLYLAFNAVHTPMNATDDRLEKFKDIKDKNRRTYAGDDVGDGRVDRTMCSHTLREKKLEDNTLVFFISDNGGPTMPGTTINASSNAPLRGSKRTTLEGGIHVPFLGEVARTCAGRKGVRQAGDSARHPADGAGCGRR